MLQFQIVATRYLRFKLPLFFALAVNVIGSGCGRIGFEYVDATDSSSTTADTNTETASDTGTGSNTTETDSDTTDTGSDTTDTGSDATDTGSNTTDTGSNTTDTGSDTTDTGSDTTDTGSDTTDTGSNTTDTGSDTTDTGSNTTDTGSDTTDTGSDTTDTGSDTTDTGSDTTDTGSDTTDTGSDTTDTDSDTTDTDSDTTDTDSDTTPEPCVALPAGIEMLSDTDLPNFAPGGATFTSSVEAVTGESFTQTWHVTIDSDFDRWPYDHQLTIEPRGDVAVGDHLAFEYWTRCIASNDGNCFVSVQVEGATDPWPNMVEYYLKTDAAWEFHQVPFVSQLAFLETEHQISFRLGYTGQEVEIAPIRLVNYGAMMPSARPDCLPDSTDIYSAVTIVAEPRLTATVGREYVYLMETNGMPRPLYSQTALPGWLTFNTSTGQLRGTPDFSNIGVSGDITLSADNGIDSDSITWQITVGEDPTLLGFWQLDGNGDDTTGYGNDGAVNGSPTWQEIAAPDYGIVVNNTDGNFEYVELPQDGNDLNDVQDGDYVISAWVQILSTPSGATIDDNLYGAGIVIKKGPNQEMNTGLWYGNDQRFHATHYFDANSPNATFADAVSDVIAPDGMYHHVAMVLDRGFGSLILYVDGGWADFAFLGGDELEADYGTAPWRIGVADPSAANYGLLGHLQIDNVRIYSRLLGDSELDALDI
ncbi:MAG: hypothetical protein JXX14_05885 [Deltaproteobacteria bacterium]|nr:hypothetical protein [Deltaproteobacteria bacterium]